MKNTKSSKKLSDEEVEKIQLRVEDALSALEETLDSIDQENRYFPKDKYTNDDKESGNPIVSSQLIAERLDAIILKMKKMLER
tara:strand:- start:1533 stop:1781 length:249 start_codon:yes stop_codon:yes gene_type:complete